MTQPKRRGPQPTTAADIDASAIVWLAQRGILSDAEVADLHKRVAKMELTVERWKTRQTKKGVEK
jgi:hypothetical protein